MPTILTCCAIDFFLVAAVDGPMQIVIGPSTATSGGQ